MVSAFSVPGSGTALLLIDVINDMAFEGSKALVARAEPMALRFIVSNTVADNDHALRQIHTVLKGNLAESLRLTFRGPRRNGDGADLWFVTSEGTGKLRDLEHDPYVNLADYKPSSYEWVSASGIARVSRDRDTIREPYEPDWKAWFGQEGDPRHGTPDDPRIVLIAVGVHAALFLEVNKPKPVVLFELANGWLTGERVEPRHTHELRAPHR